LVSQKISRLELYVEILKSVELLRFSSIANIQEETKVDKAILQSALCFLEKQNLVFKEKIENETIFKSTPQGKRITRYFMKQYQEEPNFAVSNDALSQKYTA
jgi:predicted transcriptional regulator